MTGSLTHLSILINEDAMNIKELTDQLAEKFGSHRKVAELLLIHEVGYCGIRKGRRRPSKRLVQAMKNLLAQAGV